MEKTNTEEKMMELIDKNKLELILCCSYSCFYDNLNYFRHRFL